jgi:hypothetical protein
MRQRGRQVVYRPTVCMNSRPSVGNASVQTCSSPVLGGRSHILSYDAVATRGRTFTMSVAFALRRPTQTAFFSLQYDVLNDSLRFPLPPRPVHVPRGVDRAPKHARPAVALKSPPDQVINNVG